MHRAKQWSFCFQTLVGSVIYETLQNNYNMVWGVSNWGWRQSTRSQTAQKWHLQCKFCTSWALGCPPQTLLHIFAEGFQLWLGFLEGLIFLSRQQWQEPVWGRELASSFLNRSTPTQPKPSLISEKAAWPWPARDNPIYLLETCCIERSFRYSSHARWRLWMKHLQACAHLRTARMT